MTGSKPYDVAITGGGLAGLSLAILSARSGYHTVLFEKEKYPFHRVCGEYISRESWPFLEELGLPLASMQLPLINRLQVTAPGGTVFETKLPLGGFGISRHRLDQELAQRARAAGVELREETRVQDIRFNDGLFNLDTSAGRFQSRASAGAFGKRSNLDLKWKRPFAQAKAGPLHNYIGVKYHIRTRHPADLIALHNFADGYCGISQVEDGICCLCYLTSAENLRRSGNSIAGMEARILQRNPHLRRIFSEAEFLWEQPVTISQVSFAAKSQVEAHVLLLGDAAGMITPLCGNGMSMALHAGKLAHRFMHNFLQGTISREAMEQQYQQAWRQQFSKRLYTGRSIQSFFGHPTLTEILVRSFRSFPFLAQPLIRLTHGTPF
ncbi:MAG TPA: NAD(P)/FAD-dependent oxidoreductase [Lacibacter sp.]|nr:NAD(P)/FAD-dependent oxidoreductase [Lacibacter sp.]HMO87877.1 NAD(P)/FAD-dependent oxidoreductase [Lacibacter sp.]HMP88075.1 NAD(P)/FAD-dependent oxidoreductase [Lacibacter sp.]